ncbi:hypothetical protein JEQ12_006177 [Ovis aries]|uniref:Olfactory receptor 56A4-like n=1 Tax=Ovis aries TaxID=9940 RepID=A0A835ZZD4_SHEEP|nr:hypothetical protein JEQ12_006177 [Ovis aries]
MILEEKENLEMSTLNISWSGIMSCSLALGIRNHYDLSFVNISLMYLTMPTTRLSYCAENTIKNCICTNLSVSKLSCDDITFNRLYQFVAGWTLLGSDLILIILSYSCILKAVLKIKVEGAAAKALSTCGSHFILILFFSTVLLVLVITNLARKRIPPDVPILLNILHHLIPPALNPIVYGVRTKEIKQGIQKLLRRL